MLGIVGLEIPRGMPFIVIKKVNAKASGRSSLIEFDRVRSSLIEFDRVQNVEIEFEI